MRARVLAPAAGLVLAGPTILAFRQGGYFDVAHHPMAPLIAAAVACVLVLLVALFAPVPLPGRAPGRIALGGLVLYTAWTGASIAWAPVRASAVPELERMLLYLAAFVAAMALLRSRGARRHVEPALAAGIVVVIGYALAARLLPGVVPSTPTPIAYNRLEQPLTYWNAQAALAAMGLVLCLRLTGERTRSDLVRVLAAAAAPVLGLGLWLSYSRGGLVGAAAGVLALLVLAPSWPQLRGTALGLAGAGIALLASRPFPTVSSADVTAGAKRDGVIFLAILLAIAGVTAAVAWWLCRRERRPQARVGRLPLPRGAAIVVTILTVVLGGGVIYLASREKAKPLAGSDANAARLATIDSNRYSYWRVAINDFERHPLAGSGAGSFASTWLRERPNPDPTRLAHSLEVQTASDLGSVGLAALFLFLGGVALAARRAQRAHRTLAAGACAALVVWLLHSALDWDWHMPAVTLVAIVLGGALVGLSEAAPEDAPARAA